MNCIEVNYFVLDWIVLEGVWGGIEEDSNAHPHASTSAIVGEIKEA